MVAKVLIGLGLALVAVGVFGLLWRLVHYCHCEWEASREGEEGGT